MVILVSIISVCVVIYAGKFREIPKGFLVWETSVHQNIIKERNDYPSLSERIMSRTLWHDGLVSNGDQSLVFGGLATWQVMQIDDLRRLSLVLSFIVIALGIWALLPLTKEYVIFIALFLSHTALLFFLGNGVNVGFAIGLSFLLLALLERGRRNDRSSLLYVSGVVLTMIAASYEYTPVRFIALISAPLFIWNLWIKNKGIRKVYMLFCFVLPLLILVLYQSHFGSLQSFWNARGEQIGIARSLPEHWAYWLEIQGVHNPHNLSNFGMLIETIRKRFPELLLIFFTPTDTAIWRDPPRVALLFGILPLFILIGLYRYKELLNCFFIVGSISGLMLLTTRVDVHRMAVLIPWILLPAAFGFSRIIFYSRTWIKIVGIFLLIMQICGGYALYLSTFPFNH
jgi:hypothetical protein